MKKRIELKVGETTASHLSIYSSLVEVAAAALGKKGDKGEPTEDLTQLDPAAYAARTTQLFAA